jgi:hypothetical protein
MISIPKGGIPRRFGAWTALVVGAVLFASPAGAYEQRTSTPSFGAQFGYGKLLKGGTFHVQDWPIGGGNTIPADFKMTEVFKSYGPSLHFGVRFTLDRSHALGFGFDDIRYERKGGYTWDERQALPGWLKFTTVHADYYLYFRRRLQVSYYVAPFVGIQQQELRFKKSDIQAKDYRLLYGGAGGVEYFVTRSFSVDLSGRIFALKGTNATNVTLQPALGFHFYVI